MKDGTLIERTMFSRLGISERAMPLPATTIPAGKSMYINMHPQTLYRARRLLAARSYPSLILLSFKVGIEEQLAGPGAARLDLFLPPARLEGLERAIAAIVVQGPTDAAALVKIREELETWGNTFTCDTCQVGMMISMGLHNDGPEDVLFEGALYGTAVS